MSEKRDIDDIKSTHKVIKIFGSDLEKILDNEDYDQKKEAILRHHIFELVNQCFRNINVGNKVDIYRKIIVEFEKPLISVAMNYTRGNQSRTARILGISRGTLRKKLKSYGFIH